MCVIMVCKKGIVPPYDKFRNAVWNNPHGWGLVMKDNNRLEIKRGFDEKGTDPDDLYRIMCDNDDVERALHVRWATEGAKDLDNTHPFPVFSSNSRDIYFMHNGTLSGYRPPVGITQDDDLYGASDSKRFAELKLGPLLLHLRGQAGNADYSDPLVKEVLSKFWDSTSKGLLISNNLENLYFNPSAWSNIKYEEEVTITGEDGPMKDTITKEWISSNNEYYHTLSRGFVYDERKKAEEAERARTTVSMHGPAGRPNSSDIKRLSCESFRSRHLIPSGRLAQLIDTTNLHSADNINVLSALSIPEIENLCDDEPRASAMLLVLMSSMIRNYFEDAEDAKADLENCQNVLISEKTARQAAENRYSEISSAYQNLQSELEAMKQKAQKNGQGSKSKAA